MRALLLSVLAVAFLASSWSGHAAPRPPTPCPDCDPVSFLPLYPGARRVPLRFPMAGATLLETGDPQPKVCDWYESQLPKGHLVRKPSSCFWNLEPWSMVSVLKYAKGSGTRILLRLCIVPGNPDAEIDNCGLLHRPKH
jgi:hypothetical protein